MIVVIDYGMGNLGSVANMLKKVGAKAVISSDPAIIEKAEKLILPGVGAFDNGMRKLNDRGLTPILAGKVVEEKTPILGFCLGMQLFTRSSEEGVLPGLGWIDATTVRFRFTQDQGDLKIPHMGWNHITIKSPSPLLEDMYPNARFYFVHSYHVVCRDEENVAATTLYGHEFTSAVVRGNIAGTQFHPEKSHRFGMKVFRNFVERY
ncbi:MAG: imidazole glycerol phosphate synthase subunit HisH [Anaerolineales bacterium]|jgi:glutamine amidotransferase|nr:imidazole glycerol phosphate synthase subunit HisH [Anaerolineales bacterium]